MYIEAKERASCPDDKEQRIRGRELSCIPHTLFRNNLLPQISLFMRSELHRWGRTEG